MVILFFGIRRCVREVQQSFIHRHNWVKRGLEQATTLLYETLKPFILT